MADVETKGALFDGRAPHIFQTECRNTTIRVLQRLRSFSRQIAPVLTGAYRASLRFDPPRLTRVGAEGELYSTDIKGKVRVIEWGHPLKWPNRRPRYVFTQTAQYGRGIVPAEGQRLRVDLVTRLNR